MTLNIKKLREDAIIPTTGTNDSIGYDLYSPSDYFIEPHQKVCVETGIAIEINGNYSESNPYPTGMRDLSFNRKLCNHKYDNFYIRVAPRSSMAARGIDVLAGVIDSDYRGEIKVLLINFSDEPYIIKSGHKIAQMIIESAFKLPIKEVTGLSETNRGAGGFGSTGK